MLAEKGAGTYQTSGEMSSIRRSFIFGGIKDEVVLSCSAQMLQAASQHTHKGLEITHANGYPVKISNVATELTDAMNPSLQ
jgi:hypothetical protein